jgi:spermidine/putrescine-binding protein
VIHEFSYASEKDQELLVELVKKDDKVTGLKVAVKSSTSDAALSAMAKMQGALADLLEKLMPLIAKGAMAGS